jgi:membrane fusion protein (multidrug efflux system)
VLDGLDPGDRVVVEGFQKFEPGDLVNPVPWQPQSADGTSAPVTKESDASLVRYTNGP